MGPQHSSRHRRIPAKVPNHIRRYRLQVGFTQREVARKLGVRLSTVSSWERGLTCPAVKPLFRLAKTLDTLAEALYPQFYLIRGEENVTAASA